MKQMQTLEAGRSGVSRHWVPWCAATVAGAAATCLVALSIAAQAAAPADPPVFTNPTSITNPYFPFVPGAVKIFRGQEGRTRIGVADLYLTDTRTFTLNGNAVTCRVLQETEFEDGELTEISRNFFAQADDGTVWYFGETVDDYDEGVVSGHGGSWVVGTPLPGDPPGTMSVTVPGSFMPGNPEVGDEVKPEDLPDGGIELGTVRKVGVKVRTPNGKLTDCIEIREQHLPGDEFESKWYARGVGLIKARGGGELLLLEASTMRQPE